MTCILKDKVSGHAKWYRKQRKLSSLYICLSVHLSVWLSGCLSARLPACLPACLSILSPYLCLLLLPQQPLLLLQLLLPLSTLAHQKGRHTQTSLVKTKNMSHYCSRDWTHRHRQDSHRSLQNTLEQQHRMEHLKHNAYKDQLQKCACINNTHWNKV